VRLSVKESRMKFANATNLNRKSGFDSAEPAGRSFISLSSLLVIDSVEISHQVENKQVKWAAMSQGRNRLQKVVNWHSLATSRPWAPGSLAKTNQIAGTCMALWPAAGLRVLCR
jgi:hypothetical protein